LRVFENRVLRRIFSCKKVEVAGGWRRLHNEERHNLNSSRVKDEMGRGCSTNEREMKMHTIFWSECLSGRDNSEDLDVNSKIILEKLS